MRKRYRIWVELDVVTGGPARGILPFDGVNYELTAIPLDHVERLRKLWEEREGSATFGGEGTEETISLGPRGGGCPCCGR